MSDNAFQNSILPRYSREDIQYMAKEVFWCDDYGNRTKAGPGVASGDQRRSTDVDSDWVDANGDWISLTAETREDLDYWDDVD